MIVLRRGRGHPVLATACHAPVILAAVLVGVSFAAHAQTVTYNGMLGDRALLIIDGQSQTVSVGGSAQGVKLLRLDEGQAVVSLAGKTQSLKLGGSTTGSGAVSAGPDGSRIVLTAGPGGHFTGLVNINGRSVNFVIDTGATDIGIGRDVADHIGLDYWAGDLGRATTANGLVTTRSVTLSSVRLGDVTVSDVRATVFPQPMPFVLLGNSFLSRFQMRRDNDTLVLEKKP